MPVGLGEAEVGEGFFFELEDDGGFGGGVVVDGGPVAAGEIVLGGLVAEEGVGAGT